MTETEDPGSGALIIFTGEVRNHNDGRPVDAVTYEAHMEIGERVIREIENEVLDKFDISRCRIQHRIGYLKVGEASIVIVVRSPHRAAGYEASRYAIDEIKHRTPIWKEEHYQDGTQRYLEGVVMGKGKRE
jgi:molybdopterin synthase catalytic subunit